MSFQPVVSLTTVPRDNSGFTLLDVTPTDMVSGYGSANSPVNAGDIDAIWVIVTPYGEDAQQVPVAYLNTVLLADPIPFTQAIVDGVNTYSAIYLWPRSFNYVVSADGLSITVSSGGLIALLANAKYLNLTGGNGAFPVPIIGVTNTIITLGAAITANATGTFLEFGYVATVQALTTNNGEALCINGISLLPVEADSCDNAMAIFHNLMLKLGAEIAFNCGLISKAHEAARLLGGGSPNTIPNCASCG